MKDRRYIEFIANRSSLVPVSNRTQNHNSIHVSRHKRILIITLSIIIMALIISGFILFFVTQKRHARDRTLYQSKDVVVNNDRAIANVYWTKTNDSKYMIAVGYDYERSLLYVSFVDQTSIEVYMRFPKTEWENLISCKNIDNYFRKNIKENYLHKKTGYNQNWFFNQ